MTVEMWTCHAFRCDGAEGDCPALSPVSDEGFAEAVTLAIEADWDIVRGVTGEHYCRAHRAVTDTDPSEGSPSLGVPTGSPPHVSPVNAAVQAPAAAAAYDADRGAYVAGWVAARSGLSAEDALADLDAGGFHGGDQWRAVFRIGHEMKRAGLG